MTPGLIGRMFGINWNNVRRVLKEKNVDTVFDPKWVGAEIFRRNEVLSIASDLEAALPLPKEGRYKRSKEIAMLNLLGKTEEMRKTGESDASIIDTVNFKHYKNRGFRSRIVKIMVHFTLLCIGKDKYHQNGCFASEVEASDAPSLDLTWFLLPRENFSP